ncbi:LamG domain-containing protein [Actinocrispum sp. NPDC049592]|uniref:LamG domain-containing protein n=1 Tax=Actinocrispum sp. NPDC049592 TaxID=3154835 RepID=UPI00343CBE72
MSTGFGVRASRTRRWGAIFAAALTALSLVRTAEAAPRSEETAAQVKAKETGNPVQIAGKTTETEEYFANPDGSFTWRQHERPVRVKQDNNWTPVDTTLVKRPDGTVAPKAAAVDLALSGGGRGRPLARLAHEGNEVGLGWDGELPEPRLDGAVAVYPEVLPGVDLKVTADVLGFSEVLVVKTAEAAKNPKLRKITFASHTRNTQVRAQAKSAADKPNLEVVDAKGAQVFTGTSTRMWDSSGDAGKGESPRGATMGTEVTGQAVAIIPDQDFLADKATKYPVYLDPEYSCNACGKNHHIVVQSGYRTAKNYDASSGDLSDLKAGLQTTDSSGYSRSYVEMATWAVSGKTIHRASLNVPLLYSWWGPGSATQTDMYVANGFGPGTDFDHQPWIANIPDLDERMGSNNATNQSKAPGVVSQFDAGRGVAYAASHGWGNLTFMLIGSSESNNTSWRRFGLNPYLEVWYDSTPNDPVGHAMQNGTVPCVKGEDRPWIATRTPTVQARVSDPDGGSLNIHIATSGGPYGADVAGTWHENIDAMPGVGTPGPGQEALARIQLPSGWITGDGIWKWAMRVNDGELWSPRWDWDCEFYVDTAVPLAPKLTPSGTAPVNQGDTATFNVQVDMANQIFDIDRFVYTTDGSEPSTQGSPSVKANRLVEQGTGKNTATAALTLTAVNANQNLLKVRAVSKAGLPGPNATCAAPLTTVGNACAYVVAPLTSAKFLKGAWGIDDTWGTTSADNVATLNPGETPHPLTLRGGASWAEGYSKGNSWTQADAFGAKDGTRGGMYLTNNGYLETSAKVIDTSKSFTVSAWAYLNNTNSYYTVASQDGDQVSGFFLQYSADFGKWTFSTTATDAVGDAVRTTSADNSAVPQLNTWTHLTATYDANSRQTALYIDGKKVGTALLPYPIWSANGQFVVGGAKWTGTRVDQFPGFVDDVQVWQRVLSDQDVHDLATVAVPRAGFGLAEGAGTKLATGATGSQEDGTYVPAPIPSLQGYWKFDENNGTTVSDASNNGAGYENNLITTNAAWVAGKTGSALQYNGTAGSYSYSTGRAVNTSQSFTVSAWVKLDDLTAYQGVLGQSGVHRPGFQIRYSPDVHAWIFGLNTSDSSSATTDWAYKPDSVSQTGVWTLVTGVYNNDTKQIQMYVNGKLAGTKTFSGVPWDATGHVTVGAYDFDNNPIHSFKGTIDNVQMWQRALTASQVAGLGGQSYVDSVWSLTPAVGTATGSVSETTNGDSAFASYPGSSGAKVTWPRPDFFRTDKSFTIEAWVRDDALAGGTATAVSIFDGTKMPVSLDYHPEWGGRWTFMMSGSTGRFMLGDAAPVEGKWTHLAGTFDATANRACFYIDGQLQNTELSSSGAVGVQGCSTNVFGWNNTGSVVMGEGYWNGAAVNPWRGGVAGVRLYSGVRTADQIKDDRTADDPGAVFEVRH